MARSRWLQTLAALLVCASSAWCQDKLVPVVVSCPEQVPCRPEPVLGKNDKIIKVMDGDKPAQICRVLKTWRTKDGCIARKVQDIYTGEIITVVDGGVCSTGDPEPKSVVNTGPGLLTRIFHWSREGSPPAGCPCDACDGSALVACPAPCGPGDKTVAMEPCNAGECTGPCPICKPAPRPSALQKLFARKEKVVPVPSPSGPDAAKTDAVAAAPTPNVPAPSEKPQPSDWRESWGKSDALPSEKKWTSQLRLSGLADRPPSWRSRTRRGWKQGPCHASPWRSISIEKSLSCRRTRQRP